jgi:hypothetical protein
MRDESVSDRRAVKARDAARRRVRRATGALLALSLAGVGSLAAYVAGASGRKATPTTTRVSVSKTRTSTAQVPVPATPPAPALHASSSQVAPQSSVAPPVPTAAPPVAVSGGS